jgi:two-component system OmpR family sensor kinase
MLSKEDVYAKYRWFERTAPNPELLVNRIFLRFLGPVLLSIALATLLVYAAVSLMFGNPIQQNAMRQAAPQIFLLEQYIDRAGTDEWLIRLNKVREVSQVKFDLIPLSQALKLVPSSEKRLLIDGDVVIDASQRAFFRRVDLDGNKYIGSDDDVLYARDLPIDYWFNVKTEVLRYVIVALVLLIPIGFWSRAHWRDIQALAKVTDDFGRGNLLIRASTPVSASIYPLAQQINQMAGRITQLLSAQRNLMHSVSHELRTPIARLEFGMQILQDASHDPQTNQRIQAMQGDLSELNTLVSELLNMAKMDQHQALQLQMTDAKEFVQSCLANLPPKPAHISLNYQCEDGLRHVMADQRLLVRAVDNLLKNAFKYAESAIHFAITQHGSDGWRITVEDDGPGIPDNEREKIFEAFYRLDRSRDRSTGGFGLGLSIVKQIIGLHRGVVSISESHLGGARFEIVLPNNAE